MELLEKSLWFIGFLACCLFLVPWMIRKKGVRLLFIALCSTGLTLLTIFVLNDPDWRWGDMQDQLKLTSKGKQAAGYSYINNHFVLVDNASDKAFRHDPEEDRDDSLNTVITDRRKLTQLAALLNQYPDLCDGLVLDIGFDLTTPADTLLRTELLQCANNGKLFLSRNSDTVLNPVLAFADSLYGDVRERTHEKLFVSHYAIRDGAVSLPYKLYAHFYHKSAQRAIGKKLMKESDSLHTRLFQNPFFPDFAITNESRLILGFDKAATKAETIELEGQPDHYFKLGKTINDRNRSDFIAALKKRKAAGKTNIILVGAFTSPDEDIHQTLYGRLHGPVILLNVFYALVDKQHQISIAAIFVLLLSFTLISTLLIYNALGMPLLHPHLKAPSMSYHKKVGRFLLWNLFEYLGRLLLGLIHFVFVDELPYTLLFVFALLFYLATGKMINILSLLFFFGLLEKAIQYCKKSIINRT